MHKLILPISRAVLLKCPTLAGKFSDRRAPQCLRRRYAKQVELEICVVTRSIPFLPRRRLPWFPLA